MKPVVLVPLLPLLLASAAPVAKPDAAGAAYRTWSTYGGNTDNIRYSALDQINRHNVTRLEVAWTHDTGDAFEHSQLQCNPIVVRGVLYATTPAMRIIALDAATGKLRWDYDPTDGQGRRTSRTLRGVTYWENGADRRILATAYHSLYALNAGTGKPIPEFGNAGRVDLREGLGRDPATLSIYSTTPGALYQDVLILPTSMSEDLPSAPGHIRAYDVRNGRIRWTFHTIPQPGEFGYDTWPPDVWKYTGGANCWAGMTVDHRRGIVFAPTGSATYDFWGGDRAGDNLFANCLIALKAETGERLWHFQTVRHDTWDRDLPSPPALVQVNQDGRLVDAVAQATKSGHLFVFERETGRSLFPIENRAVKASDVAGEVQAPTQPIPLKPPPFTRQIMSPEMVTRRTPEGHRAVLEKLRTLRSGGQFEPLSFQGSIVFPGFDGGAEWGGVAFDPESRFLYVNANEMVAFMKLTERPKPQALTGGRGHYLTHCAGCHREDRTGTPPEIPSLINVRAKLSEEEIRRIISLGTGRMPGMPVVTGKALQAVVRFTVTGQDTEPVAGDPGSLIPHLKYRAFRKERLLDPDGYPGVEPPWGTLNAIDLDRGEMAWRIPLGEYPELAARGVPTTGTGNYGGPLVTAGGLVFIAASNHDRKFRAFDKADGRLRWETLLPASGNATPATYEIGGRQYVVIAAGGGKYGAPSGGSYVAFALGAAEGGSRASQSSGSVRQGR